MKPHRRKIEEGSQLNSPIIEALNAVFRVWLSLLPNATLAISRFKYSKISDFGEEQHCISSSQILLCVILTPKPAVPLNEAKLSWAVLLTLPFSIFRSNRGIKRVLS